MLSKGHLNDPRVLHLSLNLKLGPFQTLNWELVLGSQGGGGQCHHQGS